MSKIHDPNVDAMFRNGQQAQTMAVASPLNDVQLLAQMAAWIMGRSTVATPALAVDLAFEILAEVAVQFPRFPQYVSEAKQRQEMGNQGPTQ